jgi:hypothetical protein
MQAKFTPTWRIGSKPQMRRESDCVTRLYR